MNARRFFGIFATLMVVLLFALPAQASPNTARGLALTTPGILGLRAIMSTGQGTGSPPPFSFSAKSPDVYQKFVQQLHPPSGCLQWEIVHERFAGGSTSNYIQIYDWCHTGVPSPYSVALSDATFRGKYVRTISYNDTGFAFQDEVVDVRTYNSTGTTWVAQIWNFNTSAYDTVVTKSGTSAQSQGYADIGDGGHTQDPTMSCPTLYPWGILQIRGIQKYASGAWNLIGSGDISSFITDSWPCISNNQYMTTSPFVYQFKLLPYGASY